MPRFLTTTMAIVGGVVLCCALVASSVLFHNNAAADSAPISGTVVCGQPILQSPYNYTGSAVTFTSGQYGLPTFGSSGTDFPADTSGVIIQPGTSLAGMSWSADTIYYFVPSATDYSTRGATTYFNGNQATLIGGYANSNFAVIDGDAKAGIGSNGFGDTTSTATGVTIEYLTFQNFMLNQNWNNLNTKGDSYWTIKYDTVGPNQWGYPTLSSGESSGGGYAIGVGSYNVIEYNCLTQNAQGAINGSNAIDPVISNNEISYNGLGEYPDTSGSGSSPYNCGCSGGGKLFASLNTTFTNNYVHNNYNDGFWFDTDNAGSDIADNYFSDNWSYALQYEASFSANIADNTFVGNGSAPENTWPPGYNGGSCGPGTVGAGTATDCTTGNGPPDGLFGTPYTAIRIDDSGGPAALTTVSGMAVNYAGHIYVEGNVLSNNFGGILVYSDTNRYPDDIDNDSACSIPLGVLNQNNNTTYYAQTEFLTTSNDTTVPAGSAGSTVTVTSTGGTNTLCSNYNSAGDNNAYGTSVQHAPSVGMGVFAIASGAKIGTVEAVSSANSFTVTLTNTIASPETGQSLYVAAYGGCSVADYFGGGPGVASGTPSADYWDNCNWGSRNISVSGNTFSTDTDTLTDCTTQTECGVNGNMAFNAGVPTLMQVWDTYPNLTQLASAGLNNVWSDNSYNWTGAGGWGAWEFTAGSQGTFISPATWMGSPDLQDNASVFSSNTDPTVALSSPAAAQEIYGTAAAVSASAMANNGGTISQCQLKIGSSLVGSALTSPPYTFALDTLTEDSGSAFPDGTYSIGVECTDNGGNASTGSASVYITNGDLNFDTKVNLSDLIILAQNYGKTGTKTYSQGNITGSTSVSSPQVNLSDLIILARNYGWEEN